MGAGSFNTIDNDKFIFNEPGVYNFLYIPKTQTTPEVRIQIRMERYPNRRVDFSRRNTSIRKNRRKSQVCSVVTCLSRTWSSLRTQPSSPELCWKLRELIGRKVYRKTMKEMTILGSTSWLEKIPDASGTELRSSLAISSDISIR